jgi:cytochrome P450
LAGFSTSVKRVCKSFFILVEPSITLRIVSWILIYISIHSHWSSAIRAEVETALSHSLSNSSSLQDRLSALPLEVWEGSMPTLDIVIRETIRLVVNQTALRRNIGGDLKMPGGVGEVPSGAFLFYNIGDVHLNPSIYTDPFAFNPHRFSLGEEEREPYSFLGWGTGKCDFCRFICIY